MEKVRFCVKAEGTNSTASIENNGEGIYFCAKGKRLRVSEGEIYDMITLFMSQFYEDFSDDSGS